MRLALEPSTSTLPFDMVVSPSGRSAFSSTRLGTRCICDAVPRWARTTLTQHTLRREPAMDFSRTDATDNGLGVESHCRLEGSCSDDCHGRALRAVVTFQSYRRHVITNIDDTAMARHAEILGHRSVVPVSELTAARPSAAVR